ncbi:hypothetical protein LA345_16145 [Burkholderia vietnamiensis]|nr:hypothetical protein [Burkholderia vietnamiensis]
MNEYKEKQRIIIGVRVSKSLKDDMNVSAKKIGLTLSSYFRMLHMKHKEEEKRTGFNK